MNIHVSVNKLFTILRDSPYTIATAESCTGGGLGAMLTRLPGSSKFYMGGIIAYSNTVKQELLSVPQAMLAQYGAVSEQVAYDMSEQVRKLFHTDIGISITGIAGPDGGSEQKPVGLVFISVSTTQKTVVEEFHFHGSRDEIRDQSVDHAIDLIHASVKKLHDLSR